MTAEIKRGFTLMEVNLAVFIMAMGVLAMIGLYPLGFRESQQSRDDVASAILADTVFNPIVSALSSTNCTWSDWKRVIKADSDEGSDSCVIPNNGWAAYCRDTTYYLPKSRGSLQSTASSAIDQLLDAAPSELKSQAKTDAKAAFGALSELGYAFAATPGRRKREDGTEVWDFSRICLSFRATRRPSMLFAQPIFYTEVHFQGDPTK